MKEMNQKDSAEATSKQQDAGQLSPTATAFMIGFLVGIIVYSVAVNTWGFLTLIPLYLIYKLLKKG